ncbi:hypothetical protein HYT17_03760 [Candidatus Microgenomates bacterium]|nr:hypothetical protein [Candidatus Microgenomates bacterium]
MSQEGETFFTIIGCMDGRCQEAVSLFGQDRFGAVYPDTITEAGLVGFFNKEPIDQQLLTSLKKKIDISLKHHHSKGILVFGHQECAASDAVDEEKHKQDVLAAAEVIKTLVDNEAVAVIPLFVKRSIDNDLSDWTAEEIV